MWGGDLTSKNTSTESGSGYNLPPVTLMIATRGKALHTADTNTYIRWQAPSSHRNNIVLNIHVVLSSPRYFSLKTTCVLLLVETSMWVSKHFIKPFRACSVALHDSETQLSTTVLLKTWWLPQGRWSPTSDGYNCIFMRWHNKGSQ